MTDLLATRDISLWFILGLVGNIALTFIPLSLPIAVFFSTIYCLNRLSSDSEYIAMRAGGLTKSRILFPFLIIAALLSVSVYGLNQNLIPASNKSFKKKIGFLTSSGLLAGIKEGQFFNLIPEVTLFAAHATKYGRNLEHVFLYMKDANLAKDKIIFGNRGELLFNRNSETLTEQLTLTLYDGNIVSLKDVDIEKIIFSKYVYPITQGQFQDRLSMKETMLTSSELKAVLQMTPKEAEKLYNFDERDLFNSRYEYWNRMNGALICFLFCFLGFTLGVTGNRGKGRNSGIMGLMCLIVYYVLYFSLVSLAKKNILPTPIAVFLPVTVIGFLGFHFYRKLDWQS